MDDKAKIILGLMDPGEGQVPFPIVAIDCATESMAKGLSLLMVRWQNGGDTLRTSAPGCYFGDGFFRVSMRPLPGSKDRALNVGGQCPGHLTHVLLVNGQADAQEYELFSRLYSLTNSYTLTLSVNGTVRLDLLHLVKYIFDTKQQPKI